MVRPLNAADVDGGLRLSTAAGWNQTREDWQRMLALEPDGCFGIECDGVLAATATVLHHNTDLAWIGMVLTAAEFRRRGFARELTAHCVEKARARCVKLDATDQGEPLYRSLGFETEQPIERWRRDPAPAASAAPRSAPGPVPASLDLEAFGADRSRFLNALGGVAETRGGEGYAMTRPGVRARYFGPCVARTPGGAADLLGSALARAPLEPWFWDLLPDNRNAVELARAFGFTPVRRLLRMRRGPDIARNDTLVYAIAGFEAG